MLAFFFFITLYYIRQIESMLSRVFSVTNPKRRQKVERTSVTDLPAARVPLLFCSHHVLASFVSYY